MKDVRSFATLKYVLQLAKDQGADAYRLASKGPGASGKPAWGVIYSIADIPPVSSGPLKIRFFRKDEPFLQDVYVLEGGEDLSDPIPTLKPQVVKTTKKKPTTAKAVAAAEDKAEAEAGAEEEHDDEDKAIAAAAQASVLVDCTSESNGNGNGKPAGLSTLLQEASSLAQALSTRTAELVADQQRLNQLLLLVRDRSPALLELLS